MPRVTQGWRRMGFKARDRNGRNCEAFSTRKEEKPFFCQTCRGEMSLVIPSIRSRPHFRHQVESNCAWEPETPDHEAAKVAVYDAINGLGHGIAELEAPVGKWIADVLWTHHGQRIAFEIQRANYTWEKFDEKFAGYRHEGVAVVYLLIGPSFFQAGPDARFRLKDLERRLFMGEVEERRFAYPGGQSAMADKVRVYPEPIGRVVGGYLRKRVSQPEELLVREPVFHPWPQARGRWSETFSEESGAALNTLPAFLHLLHRAFLERPGTVQWNGNWFGRLEEAVWAYFLTTLGLQYSYSAGQASEAGIFRFAGRHQTIGWVQGAKGPVLAEGTNEVVFDQQPTLKNDFLFVGMVGDEISNDEGILACYTRDTPAPVVDFSQYNQNFAGIVSGLHDGGSAGGNAGTEIAGHAFEIWRDGSAKLARGVGLPLGVPQFRKGGDRERNIFRVAHSDPPLFRVRAAEENSGPVRFR
jgi:hypothetical protein